MIVRRLVGAGGLALVAVLLVSCGSSTTPGRAKSAADALPAGTPSVARPLDVSRFLQAPCTVLSPAQLRVLAVSAPGKRVTDDPTGPACEWLDRDGPSKMTIGVRFLTAGHGLRDIYTQKQTYAVFQPLPDIEGYPALIASTIDDRANGLCGVDVGISNDLAVDISVDMLPVRNGGRPESAMPCQVNEQVARFVVQTLKGG